MTARDGTPGQLDVGHGPGWCYCEIVHDGRTFKVQVGSEEPYTETAREREAVLRSFVATVATAPDLLAALDDICDGACWSLGGKDARIASIPAAKITAARAAVAKARGVQS